MMPNYILYTKTKTLHIFDIFSVFLYSTNAKWDN